MKRKRSMGVFLDNEKKEALELTIEDLQLQPAFSLMHWNQLQDRQFSSVVNLFASVQIDVWQCSVAFVLYRSTKGRDSVILCPAAGRNGHLKSLTKGFCPKKGFSKRSLGTTAMQRRMRTSRSG
jgi:hypothetical protein